MRALAAPFFATAAIAISLPNAAQASAGDRGAANKIVRVAQAYRANVLSQQSTLKPLAEQWSAGVQQCIDDTSNVPGGVPLAPDADPAALSTVFTVVILDGKQELLRWAPDATATAISGLNAISPRSKKLRGLVAAKRAELQTLAQSGDIDTCSWYKTWAAAGFSKAATPTLWSGASTDTVLAKTAVWHAAGKAGSKEVKRLGVSKKNVKLVQDFPLFQDENAAG
jgi:hypothetical protein